VFHWYTQLLLIRLDCNVDKEEGDISVTTDNILHFLGAIEERTMDIISNYQRVKKMSDSARANSASGGKAFGKVQPLGQCCALVEAEPVFVNPPRLLDYSSDESGDEGAEASLRPLHRSDINYAKIAARSSNVGVSSRGNRKTINGRRGSLMFQPGGRRSTLSSTRA
jgi:hypothetical protein